MISLKNISHKFNDLQVLSDISFNIEENEIVSIMGPSGCGKSTLLKIIAGLIKAEWGEVIGICSGISFVFQDDRLLPWKTTWQNISLVKDTEEVEKIKSLIQDVGLQGFENYKPFQLSGGMRKRCGVARAFYYDGDLLLMDEPFSGLDYYKRREMLQMLLNVWNKRKQSVVFITHEVDEALEIADRIIFFSERPSKIIREIHLPNREKRKGNNKLLNEIRNEILATILNLNRN